MLLDLLQQPQPKLQRLGFPFIKHFARAGAENNFFDAHLARQEILGPGHCKLAQFRRALPGCIRFEKLLAFVA